MMGPHLPLLSPELLDIIVDHLSMDVQSLRNLSLAHPRFTALCQQRIFARFDCVARHDEDWRNRLRIFAEAILSNASASGWVRIISLQAPAASLTEVGLGVGTLAAGIPR